MNEAWHSNLPARSRISEPKCTLPMRKPVISIGNMRAYGTWPARTPGTTPILAKKVNWGRPDRWSRHRIGEGKSARSRAREGRIAELEIRKATIELCRPIHGDRRLPATITVNVVLCEEVNPPAGEDAISWMLVTNAWDTFGPGFKKFLPNGFV
jgi:hypothetical protein